MNEAPRLTARLLVCVGVSRLIGLLPVLTINGWVAATDGNQQVTMLVAAVMVVIVD